jgi:hypothetical protein
MKMLWRCSTSVGAKRSVTAITSAKDRVLLAWQADGVAPALGFEVSPTPLARTEVIRVTASISTSALVIRGLGATVWRM